MKRKFWRELTVLTAFVLALSWSASSSAAEKKDYGGWEADGAYNRHYNMAEYDEFKGKVQDIKEVVPLPGMSPGVALMVLDRDDEVIEVHLGPAWFVRNHGIRKGDKVKVRGAWAEINGRDVFMAAKVKTGDDLEYKVRLTKDGRPFWVMSAEEQAKEKGLQ